MKVKRLFSVMSLCVILTLTSCSNEGKTAEVAPSVDRAGGSYDYSIGEAGSAGDVETGIYEEPADESFDTEYREEYSISDRNQTVNPHSGLLTGGEWNDNQNYDFWTNLVLSSQREDWCSLPQKWNLSTTERVVVKVTNGDTPARNVSVKLVSGTTVLWEAMTDNNGNAYLFKSLDMNTQYMPTKIIVEQGGNGLTEVEYDGSNEIVLDIQSKNYGGDILDLMFVVDTTGSMGDELSYLQMELKDIVERVASDKQIPVRLSLNFYRDIGDEYVVNPLDFTPDTTEAINFLLQQYATGGGDYEEAVETALDTAINGSTWQEGNTKLMFLILDAPPHYNNENKAKLNSLLAEAAKLGIRIIPVASSGVDTETEFLCRTFAIATGGTYTFLTDHSGIGNSHLEPTVGDYKVEKLNDMIVRIIESYL